MNAKLEPQFLRACSAGKSDIISLFLRQGVAPDTRDDEGITALMRAARKGRIEVAEILLRRGATLEDQDNEGRTALSHAVASRQLESVRYLVGRGASLNHIDSQGWTLLDIATVPRNVKMANLLKQLGAPQRPPQPLLSLNRFSGGGYQGGPNIPVEVDRIHVQLANAFHKWRGDYTSAIEVFRFPLLVDDSAAQNMAGMNISGAHEAKRKQKYLEVQIGVPENWWGETEFSYKKRLTEAIEVGFHSMIALLQRNHHEVKSQLLLADWKKAKENFLNAPAPPFPAEKQIAAMTSLVGDIKRSYIEETKMGTNPRSP